MKEWKKINLTEEEKRRILEEKRKIKNVNLLKRLQCLELKDKKWKHQELAEFFGVSMNTITNWLEIYNKSGISGLVKWGYAGRISILTEEQKIKLQKRNKEKPFDTAKEAKQYMKEELGLDFHLHWVQKLLKKNFDCHTKNQD